MRRSYIFYTILLLMLPALAVGQRNKSDEPLNVIIIIGDGMGVSQLSVPFLYSNKAPVFTQFSIIGLVETSSATHKITDSAAGSTAMFTGRKSYNNGIGVDTDTLIRKNLVEILSEKGYQTGLVTTASVTDATPAGFYAHVSDRRMHYDIASQLLESEIDFFAGGGLKFFISTDGVDRFAANNIEMYNSKIRKIRRPEPGMRHGFLLAMDGMPAILEGRDDFLPEATKVAIDHLSKSDDGFVLMIEGAQVDWGGHSNNPEYVITEMMDFEETVRVAMDFAKRNDNTLLIVTADHETGGFALGAAGESLYGEDYATIKPSFSTKTHTATLVPLLAYGSGAEHFRGFLRNTEIFFRIIDLVE